MEVNIFITAYQNYCLFDEYNFSLCDPIYHQRKSYILKLSFCDPKKSPKMDIHVMELKTTSVQLYNITILLMYKLNIDVEIV